MHEEEGLQRVAECQAKIARLPATPPVLHDAGSEILRSIATIVLLVNAAHAQQSEYDNVEKDGEGYHAQGQAESPHHRSGPEAISKCPRTSGVKAQDQEVVRQRQELKGVCEGWKPISEALASVGCIGEWRMCEVLPPVV